MKFGCLLAVTLVACANAAPQAVAAAAVCGVPGAPCVDKKGQASRCSVDGSVCLPASAPCSVSEGAQTPCEVGVKKGMCVPVEGMMMGMCLEPLLFAIAYNHETCMDKSNGDICDYITVMKDATASYQAKGICDNGFCYAQEFSNCFGKAAGAKCSYLDFDAGYVIEYQGQCTKGKPGDFMMCSNDVEISRGPAIVSMPTLKSSAAAPSAKNTTTAVPSKGQNATAPAPSDKNQTTPLPAVTAPKNVADPAPTATPKSSATTRSTAVLTLALLIISMAH